MSDQEHPASNVLGLGPTTFFALSCGALSANLYYAQPLVAPTAQAVGLVGFALAPGLAALFALMLTVGLASTAARILVPLVEHLAQPASRRRVVGNVMSRLLGGILISRPLANFLSVYICWRGAVLASALTNPALDRFGWAGVLGRGFPAAAFLYALLGERESRQGL